LVERQNRSAIRIQTAWRGFVARKKLKAILDAREKRKHAAATTIQKSWKAHQARKEYLEIRQKIVKLQAIARMRSKVKKYQTLKSSAILVQAHWRGYAAKKVYLQTLNAVIILQFHVRR
jgi:abnormal spindle-like microcephaly-associated protein